MKNKKILFAFSILILATLACNTILPSNDVSTLPTAPFNQQIQSGVPLISVMEAKAAVDAGEAILVDVRSADAYATSHIAGSISIPLNNLENNVDNLSLNKSDWIITYCSCPNEESSGYAALLLLEHGYENVQALAGGIAAWVNAGYPTEP